MIIEIGSGLKTFKTLKFRRGLNILVSEKHKTSGSRDSRNGTGKTSLVELLHFLFQVRPSKKDDFHKEELLFKIFYAIFIDKVTSHKVARESTHSKDKVYLDEEAIKAETLQAAFSQKWFGLSSEVTSEKYTPKFGALFSFFVRKDRNGGFEKPTLNASQQKPWDSQINIAYLLGFDWRLIQKLQFLKDQKKQVDALLNMIKEGYFSDTSLDLNKMVARRDILDGDIDRKREEIASFQILDGYEEYETEANKLTQEISMLNDQNLYDLKLIEDIDTSLVEVKDIEEVDLKALYAQAQIYFGEQVKKRLEDVKLFHKQITKNRKIQLSKEKQDAQQRIKERRESSEVLQSSLKAKMDILKSHIAFERMAALQSDLNRLEAEYHDIAIQIPKLRDCQMKKEHLRREILEQIDLIGNDVQEREEERTFATKAFAEVSRYLYAESGMLSLGKSSREGGLEIGIEIKAGKSGGKNHMQIFCFDWVLAQAAKRQDKFPGFLVHDSHIFDGVDGRQIGLALRYAQEKCKSLGIQYIVSLNSDDLDKIKSAERESGEKIFDPTDFVMDTRLSDEEAGGLFGIRF